MLSGLYYHFAAAACGADNTFFGIPTWYKYLVAAGRMGVNADTGTCEIVGGFRWQGGGDVTLVAMGVLDILLRLAALVAIGFIVYGSIQYVASDGAPDRTKDAQSTIINALVGLIIALIATATVSFLGRTLTGKA